MRLYLCALCRHDQNLDHRLKAILEIPEKYADGHADWQEVRLARRRVSEVLGEDVPDWHDPSTLTFDLAISRNAFGIFGNALDSTELCRAINFSYPELLLSLLRELFGNPYRPIAMKPLWLSWNNGTIPKLAQSIYTDRAFDRLPILADALEDAGCDNADILAHCRGPGPHVLGCWVVDLLLGKE
jgi:hypothetical protein